MYKPSIDRYSTMNFVPAGVSGLKLPRLSLGLWHNFGDTSDYNNMKAMTVKLLMILVRKMMVIKRIIGITAK